MSFIQFESGREKEKIRQELREAREEMLEKAREKAEKREARSAENWMLPAIAQKIEQQRKDLEKTTKKKKEKKSKTKKQKKRDRHESDSDEETEKKIKKNKKKSKRKESSTENEEQVDKKTKQKNNVSSTSSSSSSDHDESGWIAKPSVVQDNASQETPKRDSWMTSPFMLKTFSKEHIEKKPNAAEQYEAYDPTKNVMELNPYWKSTGTGLPEFKKPRDSSDDERPHRRNYSGGTQTRRWEKPTTPSQPIETKEEESSSSSSSASDSEEKATSCNTNEVLTDEQMNDLGAKILKAELMGNIKLAEDLKQQIESARLNRANQKNSNKTSLPPMPRKRRDGSEEGVLLTHSDACGHSRPLAQTRGLMGADTQDLWGGRSAKKNKRNRVETHEAGERVRYFADDDKYDIKQMFEREKYTSTADANLQFANMAGKDKSASKDDLEDIFTDCRSDDKAKGREMQKAIHAQEKLSKKMENCERCFESSKFEKKQLVALGYGVYLSLPWHVALQPLHSILTPTQHVSASTLLDENTWEELTEFRMAITRMYASQRKDVVFFEVANKLHRRPHMCIHCVPIAEDQAEMAPFFFKKAIEESEREWSVNKQLVTLRQKNLRSSIPKGLPYFWVNFGMDYGFAHVIEDESRFPSNFAMEIIGGMLGLNANTWRKPRLEKNIIDNVKEFAEIWKKYDCSKND